MAARALVRAPATAPLIQASRDGFPSLMTTWCAHAGRDGSHRHAQGSHIAGQGSPTLTEALERVARHIIGVILDGLSTGRQDAPEVPGWAVAIPFQRYVQAVRPLP